MAKIIRISRFEVLCKKNCDCVPPAIELIYTVEKHNALTTINCGASLFVENFAFKVCNTALIMPCLCDFFSFLFLGGFKMNI